MQSGSQLAAAHMAAENPTVASAAFAADVRVTGLAAARNPGASHLALSDAWVHVGETGRVEWVRSLHHVCVDFENQKPNSEGQAEQRVVGRNL